MRLRILPLVLILVGGAQIHGQQAVVPAGGEATGSGGTVSWTLGQVDYEASQSSGGNVQRGVQQPYEWLVMSADEAARPTVSVWPNPTADQVRLEWNEPLPAGARFLVSSSTGALIDEGPVTGTTLTIQLERQASGQYVVRIMSRDRILNTLTLQRQ